MKNLNKLKKAELIEYVQKREKEADKARGELFRYIKDLEKEKKEIDDTIIDLNDKIQDLTIRCKYAEFDAEAGQREIDYLKKLLKNK